MKTAILPEREAQVRASFNRSPMLQMFGASIEQIAQGYLEIKLPKQAYMARKAGMFNGGIIAALIDACSGYAATTAQPNDCYFVTVELKVNYLHPAMGDYLLAKADVIKSGSVITVVRTDVYAVQEGNETLAATSLVTMMQLKNKIK